ncbi:aminotransferase class V-fold PLP-dependent enzyme [Enterococcus larvae]|uniref:aminotransferase class V-fold PLP-dependent enzyme n=1 Tax=Enterococcus larvae TaxID=2794352 RepID=UPI003F2DAEA6
MFYLKKILGSKFDEVNTILELESGVMNDNIILIGSANFPFPSVMEALKYPFQFNPAEGVANKRFFPKCDSIDSLEIYGEKLLKQLLNDEGDKFSSSLQPYSGTQANQIIYNAILHPGDCVLAMSSKAGGHVSHNNFIQRYFHLKQYDLNGKNEIDYDQIEQLCKFEKPKLLIAGASSYPYSINYKKLGEICQKYGIYLLADISHTFNYISCGLHNNPINFADFITFTTHKTTRGIRGGILMFKKEYASLINPAIFPITQGAPKYNEILAKVIMLVELSTMDIESYCRKVLWYTNTFIEYFNSKGIATTSPKSELHFTLIDLTKNNLSGKEAEEKLASINILVNRNLIPADKKTSLTTSGIRIGFLTLATIDFSKKDFYLLMNIIYEELFTDQKHTSEEVTQLINKYKIVTYEN